MLSAVTSGVRPGTTCAPSSLTRSLVPSTSTVSRSDADPMATQSRIARGVSTMAHSEVCSGAPAAVIAEASERTSSARLTLGTTIPAGPAAHTAARSSSCQGEPSPLMRMVSSRIPYAPETAAAQASSRAALFASGATASSRSRISPSTGRLLAFSTARSLDAGR